MGASTSVFILSSSATHPVPKYLNVALPVPLRDCFSYLNLPNQIITAGCRVRVRFGPRELIGIVTSVSDSCHLDDSKLKTITEALDSKPLMHAELLHLCDWAATYYFHSIGEVISATMPTRFREGKKENKTVFYRHTSEGLGLNQDALKRAPKQQAIHQHLLSEKSFQKSNLDNLEFSTSALNSLLKANLIEAYEHEEEITENTPEQQTDSNLLKQSPLPLNEEQEKALSAIRFHKFEAYLLEGVTGSGKTEVYMQAIARVLQSGNQALVLIPEIGLSAQTIRRLKERFNVPIAELHSDISEGQRAQNWIDARNGKAKIVVGTRLASLCPFKNLGLLIVDEEHDRSYKQQDGFKYSARDLSIYRAHTLKVPILLGSATPSVESALNAKNQKYQHLLLTQRAGEAELPDTIIVDLKSQKIDTGLSEKALTHLAQTIKQNQQALVFVNRRGYAPALLCHQCGWHGQCSSCDARMTVHQNPYKLICHYCERKQNIPRSCPQCGAPELITKGLGTEQIEAALQNLFPNTPIVRIDRDSTSAKNSLAKLLEQHQDGGACIYVGTQMLAKGHHLKHLSLGIILDADQGFMSPDFRSVEQMGQLLIQVAGRPGRAEAKGTVVVQSHYPEHPLLQMLIKQDYRAFIESLLEQRKAAYLPPYVRSVLIRAESKRAENANDFLRLAKQSALNLLQRKNSPIQIIGPLPSSQEKINERFRYCLQFYSADRKGLAELLDVLVPNLEQHPLGKRTRWSIDVDNVTSS